MEDGLNQTCKLIKRCHGKGGLVPSPKSRSPITSIVSRTNIVELHIRLSGKQRKYQSAPEEVGNHTEYTSRLLLWATSGSAWNSSRH